jgi:hypothetical protein
MADVSEGKGVALDLIKTVYTVKGIEKEQWWVAFIDTEYYTIHQLVSNAGKIDFRCIERYFQELDSKYPSDITFIPCQSNNTMARRDRSFHRGYINDTDPFVFRGKTFPELLAKGSSGIFYRNYSSFGTLTYGQRGCLHQWFDSQLLAALNQDLLNFLIRKAKTDCRDYCKGNLAELEKSIQDFKEFLDSIK